MNEGLKRLGEGSFSSSTIKDIRFPSTLRVIKARTFENCKSLESAEIPNGIKYIENMCFSGSGIKELLLSSTTIRIGEKAFIHCNNLKIIWVNDQNILIGKDVNRYVKILPMNLIMIGN